MNWAHLSILLAIGALHSASLWIVTLGFKRLGMGPRKLTWAPFLMALPSGCLGFPFALVLVTGIRPLLPIEWAVTAVVGVGMSIPAAFGAEVAYRIATKLIPRVVDRLLGRLGGG
jgi:hypothetical protein